MNPEEEPRSHETLASSIESAVVNYFPGFSPDKSRLMDTSSGERGILEFYQEGKDRAKDPVLYVLLKKSNGLTAYAQHLPPPEGRISLMGATSFDFDEKGEQIPWAERDIDLMLGKLKVFTDGVQINDQFLDQVATYSPRSSDLVTFRQRLTGIGSNLEQPQDEHETINWNDVDPELRAIYEEEMEALQMSTPVQTLGGIGIRQLAVGYPNLSRLITEENVKRGNALPGLLGIGNPFQALDEIRSRTPLGERIIKAELHRLDAIEGMLDTNMRLGRLRLPQQSS